MNYLYVINTYGTKFYKVGITDQAVEQRLANLQTGNALRRVFYLDEKFKVNTSFCLLTNLDELFYNFNKRTKRSSPDEQKEKKMNRSELWTEYRKLEAEYNAISAHRANATGPWQEDEDGNCINPLSARKAATARQAELSSEMNKIMKQLEATPA